MVYDLIVIGKGIAACAALITLSKTNKRIAVIAPKAKADFKIGETLSPSANVELKKLGIYSDFLTEGHLKAYSSFSSWGSDELNEKYIWEAKQEAGWYIDRLNFEEFLWAKAQHTTFEYIDDTLVQANFNDDLWQVKTKSGQELTSRYVLDCSGRAAIVCRNFHKRKRLDKLVSIYTVLSQKRSDVAPTVASVVEALENGWMYSSLTPNNKLVVAYFTDSDLIPSEITKNLDSWKQFIASTRYTSKRIETAEFSITTLPHTVDAATIITHQDKADTLLCAGDAVASFDPLSSHGMTTALWSGRKVAEAFIDLTNSSTENLKNYKETLYQSIDNYILEKQKIYATEKRFAKNPFWSRRLFKE